MNKIVYSILFISLIYSQNPIVKCVASTETESSNKNELVMGIFPRRNPIHSTRMFAPLAEYLSKHLDRKVVLRTPGNFSVFWEGIRKREYDIVHFNQYHYVKSHKEFGYNVILMNIEFGEPTIAGSIIVREDSNIKKISDLKNKTIVFGGGPKAMQSYIVARYLLQENGLSDQDYKYSFAKNPPNAIMSTYFNQSDAAGSGDKVLRLNIVNNQINIEKLKFLIIGEQLSHLPWAVKNELPTGLVEQIQSLMQQLENSEKGETILKKMRLDGFLHANDHDYDKHRIIIRKVLGEDY